MQPAAGLAMRYAIVTETYPPEVNGVALTVASAVHGLRRRGHDVEVVRPAQHDEAPGNAPGELRVRGCALPRYPGLRFGLPSGRRLLARWRDERPDAIYVATEGPLGWSALWAARRLGIPAATGLHTRFDQYMRSYGLGPLEGVALRWMRRFHARGAVTLVPTQELADMLRRRGFAHAERLPRTVDCTRFSPDARDAGLRRTWGLGPRDLAVMYFGRLAPEKNLDLAVRAYRSIAEHWGGPGRVRMVWIGDGPERGALEAAHPDHVFCGIRTGASLARYVASCDLFLFPSTSETFGNVILEAMACGVATVAFDRGAAREHLRHGVEGACVEDDATFVHEAVRIALDDDLRLRMGVAARAAMRALDSEATVVGYEQALSRIARDAVIPASRLAEAER